MYHNCSSSEGQRQHHDTCDVVASVGESHVLSEATLISEEIKPAALTIITVDINFIATW